MLTKYKFRCSSLGKLMTNSRGKSDPLSQTTKTYLKDVYIEEAYGRRYEFTSKYTDKGKFAEQDSLKLVTENRDKFYSKNRERFENQYVSGNPDIIDGDTVIDIKTCWNMKTFISKDIIKKDYMWQLQGYMWLTDLKKAELIYTLVNTPPHLIVSEKTKQMYANGLEDGSPEMAEMEARIDKWMTFDDVDPKLRMRVFELERDEKLIDQIKIRVEDARVFLNNISLN